MKDAIEAMEMAVKQWRYMDDNGLTDKQDVPFAEDWSCHCALCEFAGDEQNEHGDEVIKCGDCPMYDYWASDDQSPVRYQCEKGGGPYKAYTDNKCSETVKGMLDALEKRLESMKKQDKPSWMSQDLSDLKEGDDVYCLLNGHGVADRVNDRIIKVQFEGWALHYYPGGKMYTSDANQSLFKGKHHPFNPQPNPLGVQIGDKIEVWDGEVEYKPCGEFAAYVPGHEYPWRTSDQVGYKNAGIPVVKTEIRVKSTQDIYKILIEGRYKCDEDGTWEHNDDTRFNGEMWACCGKSPGSDWCWESEWLKEVEVK